MKNQFYFFIFLVLITSCSLEQKEDSTLAFDDITIISKGHILYDSFINGWYINQGCSKPDRNQLVDNKTSLRIYADTEANSKKIEVYYLLNINEVDVDYANFSGQYRFQDPRSGYLDFSIIQIGRNIKETTLTYDTTKIYLTAQDTAWHKFSLKSTIKKDALFLCFLFSSKGQNEFWIGDCRVKINNRPLCEIVNVEYGAETDKEFDSGSNIELNNPTSQMYENLEILCKVWGFLKYYHPEVTKGKYNWDYELFRILPQIANAKNKSERNKLLNKWLDRYGEITEQGNYIVNDSSLYSRIINIDWINDENIFDDHLILDFTKIKNAKRSSKLNYYTIPFLFTPNKQFLREKRYENISWKDQGFRILTLFRLWNIIEYCYPYVEMTDTSWSSLIKEYLPYFVSAESESEYQLTILKLFANINDTHGEVKLPNPIFKNTDLAVLNNRNIVPVKLMLTKDETIVVVSTNSTELKQGDIILTINDEPVFEIIEKLAPYIPASNRTALINKVLPFLLNTSHPELKISYLRKGKQKNTVLRDFNNSDEQERIKLSKDYNLDTKNIFYIDVSTKIGDLSKINDYAGLIIDIRNYPTSNSYPILQTVFNDQPKEFMWFSSNDKSVPGRFILTSKGIIGTNNPTPYNGKVAILVSESTLSHGEFSAIAYRTASPNSAIIGSTTAGADGNIGQFYLPHNISVVYTALGAYYPNWEPSQRVGVKIDIPVRPTVEDIKQGRDVWIEKAIKFIEE